MSSSPATVATPVTPSDTVDISGGACRALYVGGAGDVTAVCGGEAVLFTGVQAGTVLPVNCTRVNATGTTATNIVALY